MRTVYTTPRRAASSSSLPAVAHHPSIPPLSPREGGIPEGILPPELTDILGADLAAAGLSSPHLEEIRLRADRYATLTAGGRNIPTRLCLSADELGRILVRLCGGSLYAYSDSIREGYITLPGGIRVGIGGHAVCEEGRIIGVSEIDSLCIRLPHRHARVGGTVAHLIRHMAAEGGAPRGVLIYAPPGVGKTTLLRGIAAHMAGGSDPWRTVIVDSRGELGLEGDDASLCLDVLHGYPRGRGVEIATRTLSAQLIICDEIGDVEEAMSLISAHHGGVPLIATAHAGTVGELLLRPGIRLLHEARLFGAYVGISRRPSAGEFVYRITPHEHAEREAGGILP